MSKVCIAEDRLFLFAVNELPDDEKKEAEKHIQTCKNCLSVYEDLSKTADALRDAARVSLEETPPDLLEWALHLPKENPALLAAEKTGEVKVLQNFVFALAGEGAPIFLKYREDESEPWSVEVLTDEKIFPRFVYEVQFNGDVVKKVKAPEVVKEIFVLMDKRVYTADEEANLLLYSNSTQTQSVTVTIRQSGRLFYWEEIPLHPKKIVHKRIAALEEGEYEVYLERGQEVKAVARFTVAPYTLPTLEIKPLHMSLDENGKLNATLKIHRFGEPLNGKIHVSLRCESCERDVPPMELMEEKVPIEKPYVSFRDIVHEITLTEEEVNRFLNKIEAEQAAHHPQSNFMSLIRMLRRVDHKTEVSIIEGLYEKTPELAELVSSAIFSLHALPLMAKRDLQDALLKVSDDRLALAILNQPKDVVDAVLNNVSKRKQECIKEELAYFLNRKADTGRIQAAQKEVKETVKAVVHAKRGTFITIGYNLEKRLKENPVYEHVEVINGEACIAFPIGVHRGGYTLALSTKDGDTGNVELSVQKSVTGGAQEDTKQTAYSAFDSCYNFSYSRGVSSGRLLNLLSISQGMIQAEAKETLRRACVVTLDAQGNPGKVVEFKNVKSGSALLIEADARVTQALYVAAEIEKKEGIEILEEEFIIDIPHTFPEPLSLPENVQPGDVVSLSELSQPMEFALIVKDTRLGKNQLTALIDESHIVEIPSKKEVKLPPQESRLREDFRDVAFCGVVTPETLPSAQMKFGQQIGKWKATLYGFKDNRLYYEERVMNAIPDFFVELDTPALTGEKDAVECHAFYRTPVEATLKLHVGKKELTHKVSPGNGVVKFTLTRPQTIYAELKNHVYVDRTKKEVKPSGKTTVIYTYPKILRSGDSLEAGSGKILTVYPNSLSILERSLQSLLEYPFENASEPVASKLWGLAALYNLAREGKIQRDTMEIAGLMQKMFAWLQRFEQDGLFSFGDYTGRTLQTTIEIALRLYDIIVSLLEPPPGERAKVETTMEPPFTNAWENLEAIKSRLLKEKIKDNLLVRLDPGFCVRERKFGLMSRLVIGSAREASEIYFYGPSDKEKKEAYKFIKETAKINGRVWWDDPRALSGAKEATCYALKVLFAEKDELFYRGFSKLCDDMQDFRFHATSDTVAFIGLLKRIHLKETEKARVVIDGEEKMLERVTSARKVEVVGGNVMALTKESSEIDVRNVKSALDFEFAFGPRQLRCGEKVSFWLDAMDVTPVPAVKIYLPGMLAISQCGVNMQSVHALLPDGHLHFEAAAIRRGIGKMVVVLYDMYRKENVGVKEVDVEVR